MRAIILLLVFLFPVATMANEQFKIENFQNDSIGNAAIHLTSSSRCYNVDGENIPISECMTNTKRAASLWINGVLHGNICRLESSWCHMNGFYVVESNCFCPHFFYGKVTTY